MVNFQSVSNAGAAALVVFFRIVSGFGAVTWRRRAPMGAAFSDA